MLWILSPRVLLENGLYYAAGGLALWRGGRAARVAAAALLIENTLSILAADVSHLEAPRFLPLTLDVVVLGVILQVAFTSDRRWPLLVSALQILSILTFVTRIIDPTIVSWSYVTIDIALSFVQMAAVVYGALTRAPKPAGPVT